MWPAGPPGKRWNDSASDRPSRAAMLSRLLLPASRGPCNVLSAIGHLPSTGIASLQPLCWWPAAKQQDLQRWACLQLERAAHLGKVALS